MDICLGYAKGTVNSYVLERCTNVYVFGSIRAAVIRSANSREASMAGGATVGDRSAPEAIGLLRLPREANAVHTAPVSLRGKLSHYLS